MVKQPSVIAVFLLAACLSANAADGGVQEPPKKRFNLPPNPLADPLMATNAFLDDHPDLRLRLLALEKYRAGKLEDAFRYFRRAAYYADKPSQGMVAEMLWEGRGTPRDAALAYAWMDVAAERGYLGFLSLRERYWDALGQAERERALREGAGIYAEYGDEVAEPRLNAALRRGQRSVAGSRTGFVGAVSIYIEGYGEIPASQYFAPKYWDPKQYREWHDQVWQKPLTGQVKVGDVEAVGDRKATPTTPQPDDPPGEQDPR